MPNCSTDNTKRFNKAVSTVINVILMVAVVVSVSSFVIFYLSNMTDTKDEETFEISFLPDKNARTLTVTKLTTNLSWNDLKIDGGEPPAGKTYIKVGQKITSCEGTVNVIFNNNTLIGTWDF